MFLSCCGPTVHPVASFCSFRQFARANGKQTDGTGQGSAGALLQHNGLRLCSVAVYLGDVTNNIAEYHAVWLALTHAVCNIHHLYCFRVDSMLVARQLQGCWACRAAHLQHLYMACLDLIGILRRRAGPEHVQVQHIYREYNGDADGLANEAIDRYDARQHQGGVVVDLGWSPRGTPS